MEILEHIKSVVLKDGINSVISFLRAFSKLGHLGKLSKKELGSGLEKIGITLSWKNLKKLYVLFDVGDAVSVQEFLNTIIGEMNNSRDEKVNQVFRKLDKDEDKLIEVQDILSGFNASKIPEVAAKKKTEKQALAQFLDIVEIFFSIMVNNAL